MKIEVFKDGKSARIRVVAEVDVFHPFGGSYKTDAKEEMLIPEARRLYEALGKAIKEAEVAQRPGVRKLGDY